MKKCLILVFLCFQISGFIILPMGRKILGLKFKGFALPHLPYIHAIIKNICLLETSPRSSHDQQNILPLSRLF